MKNFKERKDKYLLKLRECKQKIEHINNMFDSNLINKDVIEKINRTIDDIEKEKIKVVLFGAFSDGKSTIVSALLDRTDIKISPEPTTDEINLYSHKDFFIVDTPGLFSEKTEHDEKTKQYISEADLIIFTTDAVNPLKESQHPTIKWILKDLNKINQTIFIINKLDTTGIDIENSKEFEYMCNIKKNEVIKILNNILGSSNNYNIVCLSSDPYGEGITYWLNNKEEYERLSNIKALESVMEDIIKKQKYELIEDKIKAVLLDITGSNLDLLKENLEKFEEDLERYKLERNELAEEVKIINRDLSKAVMRLKNRLIAYRHSLVEEINTCVDEKCISDFVIKKIGKDGYILKEEIELISREELSIVNEGLKSTIAVLEKIEKFYEELEKLDSELLKSGINAGKYLSNIIKMTPVETLRNFILGTRNFLGLPIKFAPWQVVNISKSISKLSIVSSVFFDLVGIGIEVYKRNKLNENIREITMAIEEVFKNVLEEVNEQKLKETYFKNILELEEIVKNIDNSIQEIANNIKNIKFAINTISECKEF